jgi:hypothetical protein
MQATRFHVVASLIGVVAVVALLALAYDTAAKGTEESQTSLIQVIQYSGCAFRFFGFANLGVDNLLRRRNTWMMTPPNFKRSRNSKLN